MRMTGRAVLATISVLAVGGLLSGCAANRAPPPTSPAAATRTRDGDATIVAVRPAGGNAALVLSALGTASAIEASGVSEFILREDSGRTIAVVQANLDGLHAGERVRLVGLGRARLKRLANGAPSAA